MRMIETVSEYITVPCEAERAVFEAAMIKRIDSEKGYNMRDLLFEVYQCQTAIAQIQKQLEGSKKCSRKSQ